MYMMFVVLTYGTPEYHEEIVSVDGIVNNETEFNTHLDERFPGLRNGSTRTLNEHGLASVHYEMVGWSNLTKVVMKPIKEIGKPKS